MANGISLIGPLESILLTTVWIALLIHKEELLMEFTNLGWESTEASLLVEVTVNSMLYAEPWSDSILSEDSDSTLKGHYH